MDFFSYSTEEGIENDKDARYGHYGTSIGILDDQTLIVVASYGRTIGEPNHKKVEIRNSTGWFRLPHDYPVSDFQGYEGFIQRYSFVNFNNQLFLFGKLKLKN